MESLIPSELTNTHEPGSCRKLADWMSSAVEPLVVPLFRSLKAPVRLVKISLASAASAEPSRGGTWWEVETRMSGSSWRA